MNKGIYIAGAGPGSGKSLIVLGLMERLVNQGERIGFFRPVVAAPPEADPLSRLIRVRYGSTQAVRVSHGCDMDTARALVHHGAGDELIKRILGSYRALAAECELVLCAGTDFRHSHSVLEFDFNTEVANNLDCGIVPVLSGLGQALEQIVDAAVAVLESLAERDGETLALVINRAGGALEALGRQVRTARPDGPPLFVVPEVPMLAMPTIGEIATALQARWIYAREDGEGQEVADYKVAAMELPNFLEHLDDACLVITPGDRSDIVLGTLAADRARTYPHVAGLLLSGGLEPAPQVRRLIEGIAHTPLPVLGVATDTYQTARTVTEVEGRLAPEYPRKIAAALGTFESHVDTGALLHRLATRGIRRITPLMFEFELIQRAKADRRHIVLPEARDERVLRAAEILLLREVVTLTLLGPVEAVREHIARLGLRLDAARIVDPLEAPERQAYAETYYTLRRHKGISRQMALDAMADVSYFGTMMVHHGAADGMVSGAAHTTQHTIRPAFEIIKTTPGTRIVSSVFFMCLADRVLVYGDCAVNPDPDAEQLADIAISSAETARQFGVEPRIAMLSYSTGHSGRGKDVDKVREATRIARARRPDLKIDGPIQYDAAVDASVARTKMPDSEVAGRATVFIFPDLNTGNNTYKAVQRSAGAVAIGPVLQGLNRPVNDLSRGCTVTDIVNTVAITAIQAQSRPPDA